MYGQPVACKASDIKMYCIYEPLYQEDTDFESPSYVFWLNCSRPQCNEPIQHIRFITKRQYSMYRIK